jgi:NAD(P)-dependent dehydrogenase (short-subunit alcohol dehydrogenase family)
MRVLVTGGAQRIGAALCRTFAAAGHKVVIHYRHSAAEAAALLAELGGHAAGHATVPADLTDPAQLAALLPGLRGQGRAPDCLVNSAGSFPRRRLVDETAETLRETFWLNTFAPFLLMRDFARLVGRGAIVNLLDQRIASVNPDVGAYAIAKQSLRDFTLAAALDWAPAIRVNAVAPGLSLPPPALPPERRAAQLTQVPLGQEVPPTALAEATLYLATAEHVTGQILYVDGGLHLTRLQPSGESS